MAEVDAVPDGDVPDGPVSSDLVQSKPTRDDLYKILELLLAEHNALRAEHRQTLARVAELENALADATDEMRVRGER